MLYILCIDIDYRVISVWLYFLLGILCLDQFHPDAFMPSNDRKIAPDHLPRELSTVSSRKIPRELSNLSMSRRGNNYQNPSQPLGSSQHGLSQHGSSHHLGSSQHGGMGQSGNIGMVGRRMSGGRSSNNNIGQDLQYEEYAGHVV